MIVALFDALTVEVVYEWLLDQELSIQAAAPFLGAVGPSDPSSVGFNANVDLRRVRSGVPRAQSVDSLREVPGKLAAGITIEARRRSRARGSLDLRRVGVGSLDEQSFRALAPATRPRC